MVNTKTGWSHPVPFAIGYDLWMYGALLIIPLLVFATKIIMSNKTRGFKEGTAPISPVVHLSWKSVELKLMAVPIIFLLLRMWSMIMGILFIYSKSFCSVPPTVIKALIVLAVSVLVISLRVTDFELQFISYLHTISVSAFG